MAGEELKTPGADELTTENPLYFRGITRNIVTPPPVQKESTDILYLLAVAVLSVTLSYLIFVPIILLLVL